MFVWVSILENVYPFYRGRPHKNQDKSGFQSGRIDGIRQEKGDLYWVSHSATGRRWVVQPKRIHVDVKQVLEGCWTKNKVLEWFSQLIYFLLHCINSALKLEFFWILKVLLSVNTVDQRSQRSTRRRFLTWAFWRRSFLACGPNVRGVRAVYMRTYSVPGQPLTVNWFWDTNCKLALCCKL